jgi:hypothetical protein
MKISIIKLLIKINKKIMNIFKDYTYKWWQMALLKICMALIGIAIGAYWQKIFLSHVVILLVVGFAIGFYLVFITFRKK